MKYQIIEISDQVHGFTCHHGVKKSQTTAVLLSAALTCRLYILTAAM